MKRELKVVEIVGLESSGKSCRDNPYEEGTESRIVKRKADDLSYVAEIIPMKRELKVLLFNDVF